MRFKAMGFAAVVGLVIGAGMFSIGRRPVQAATPDAPMAPPAASPPIPFRADIDTFFNRVGQGKIDEALPMFDLMLNGNAEARENFSRMLGRMYGSLGKYQGNEIVSRTTVSSQLQRVECMVYFDKHFVLFTFAFWHKFGAPADQWKVVSVNTVDNTDEMFKGRPAVEYHESIHLAEPADAPAK